MITKRVDRDGYTEILIYNEDAIAAYEAYRVSCMDFDYDRRADRRNPPTAQISLLCATSATIEQARRLADEYQYVAAVASELQIEKRAQYAERYGVGV